MEDSTNKKLTVTKREEGEKDEFTLTIKGRNIENLRKMATVSSSVVLGRNPKKKESRVEIPRQLEWAPEWVYEPFIKKLEAYREFSQKMAFSFEFQSKSINEKAAGTYKFYVGKWNNHMLIRALMRTRWWWSQTDSKNPKDINFMWTQWRNKKFIEALPAIVGQDSDEQAKTHRRSNSDYMKAMEEGEVALEEKITDTEESKGESIQQQILEPKTTARNLEGVVTDGLKRLFSAKEIEVMKSNPDMFKPPSESNGSPQASFRTGASARLVDSQNTRVCNHIENNGHLANKKALLVNMKNYYTSIGDDAFKHLPLTFHIKNGLEDEEYLRFEECYRQREKEINEQETEEKGKQTKKLRNIWIVKPGEDTNKGKGIFLINDLTEIKELIGSSKGSKGSRTYLIQLYLDKPLLYNKRKFDIRCYMLVSCINGIYKGYWYQEGYIRTSSKEFTLKDINNKQIHLTNDAIQVKYPEYGKWEPGNKVSYAEFERYLQNAYTVDFYKTIYPQMKTLATDTMKAVYGIVDPYKRENTFEIFGLDFMIDANYNVWLIEVNTNPDICIPTPKLGILIPAMVENALRLTIDPLFPPPNQIPRKKQNLPENFVETNKFELVFDEREEGHILRRTLKTRKEGLKVLSENDLESKEENEAQGKE